MKPIGKHVVLRMDEPATMKNGVHIPDHLIEPSRDGEVVAVGPKVENIREGMRVRLFADAAGVQHEGLVIVPSGAILFIH